MQVNSTHRKHYLDYYKDWKLALFNAKQYLGMLKVYEAADRFIGILTELKDADLIRSELAAEYITEVNHYNNLKLNTFLN